MLLVKDFSMGVYCFTNSDTSFISSYSRPPGEVRSFPLIRKSSLSSMMGKASFFDSDENGKRLLGKFLHEREPPKTFVSFAASPCQAKHRKRLGRSSNHFFCQAKHRKRLGRSSNHFFCTEFNRLLSEKSI